MKFYKTTAPNGESQTGRSISWQVSQADAASARAGMRKEGLKSPETVDVEIATDKKGLCEWLNQNLKD